MKIYNISKRLIDILVATVALVLTCPLILTGAIAIKLTSSGPIFYRASRAGQDGRRFTMFKLRTMRCGTDRSDMRVTAQYDERIILVGSILRRFKIDELPQFWNVLRGELSIVGPRPEDWEIVQRHYTEAQRKVLQVRPGIASLADVRWYPDLTYHDPPPNGVPIQEWYVERHLPAHVAEGIRYIEQRSFWLDLKILAETAFCVLVRSWIPPRQKPLPMGSSGFENPPGHQLGLPLR